MNTTRRAEIKRETLETKIEATLNLDGTGKGTVNTGIAFLDHLLGAIVKHARIDLDLSCVGDLHVDDHHTVEDTGLVLGEAFDKALGERRGVARFGSAFAPLDEALARAVIDLSGRPFASINLELAGEKLGAMATENISHFLRSFASSARAAVHVDVLKGENDHHRAEAAFKAFALALRSAVRIQGPYEVPSTKGSL